MHKAKSFEVHSNSLGIPTVNQLIIFDIIFRTKRAIIPILLKLIKFLCYLGTILKAIEIPFFNPSKIKNFLKNSHRNLGRLKFSLSVLPLQSNVLMQKLFGNSR